MHIMFVYTLYNAVMPVPKSVSKCTVDFLFIYNCLFSFAPEKRTFTPVFSQIPDLETDEFQLPDPETNSAKGKGSRFGGHGFPSSETAQLGLEAGGSNSTVEAMSDGTTKSHLILKLLVSKSNENTKIG
jgi:hypothetical protein